MNEEMAQKLKEAYKNIKGLAICIAILMILLGLTMFFLPVTAIAIAIWMMVAGLILRGIVDIVIYCKTPAQIRDGWFLATGIIWVVLGCVLVYFGINGSELDKLVAMGSFTMVLAIMISFTCIFEGIKCFCTVSEAKKMGGGNAAALRVISGVLGVLVGIIILSYPIGSFLTLTVFYGLFLTIGGIALLIRTLSE